MKWTLAAALGATVLATHLSAALAQEQKMPPIGYAAGKLDNPFMAAEVNVVLDAAKKAGLNVLPVANANGDAGRQVTDFHNLIAAGAGAILVMPLDSNALAPAVDFAASRKVPAVAIDVGAAGGKTYMIVRADNVRMGKSACEAIGKALGGKGTVLALLGDLSDDDGKDRTSGFTDCMKASFPDIKINLQPTHWKTDKAVSAAQTVVSSTPDLGAIYMESDSVMVTGVLNVLKGAGKLKKVGAPGHIVLVTIDGTPQGLEAIRQGYVDTVISQPLDLYGKYSVYYLKAAVAGKTFPKGPTDHDSVIEDFEGSPMDLLPARNVTTSNVDDPSLWGNRPTN